MVDDTAAIARLTPNELSSVLQQSQREPLQQQAWLESDAPWMACLGGNFSVPRVTDLRFDEAFESWGSEDRDLAFRLFHSGMRPHLLPHPNAVHIRLPGDLLKEMDHQSVVELLENKILLRSKYPNGEMRPSLELLRYCHFDKHIQKWFIGPSRTESVDVIIYEFERWKARTECRTAAV